MATTFDTLNALTIKGLCAMMVDAPDTRDRVNAAEMLHARILERSLNRDELSAVRSVFRHYYPEHAAHAAS